MTSTFRGLETGKSALAAANLNQDVTGHNIANANTVGYSRQRAVQEARRPVGLDYIISQTYNKMVGQGVNVTDIQQIRSDYLDEQYRNENNIFANYDYRGQGLTYLTGVMKELDDNSSLTLCLKDLSSALSGLNADPTSKESRLNVQQRANTLIQNLKYVHNEMTDLWSDQNTSMKTVADSINSKAEQISMLNAAIANYEHGGGMANDLRDQRNNLLDELSALTSITYSQNTTDASMVDVKMDGVSLVDGQKANTLTVSSSVGNNAYSGKPENVLTLTVSNPDNTTTTYTVSRNADPSKNEIQAGGELKAHLDLLESDDPTVPGIPYYIGQLNKFAQEIAKQVNEIHIKGYTTPDNTKGTASQTGIAFFARNGDDSATVASAGSSYYDGITADNLSLSSEVAESVWNIAASDKLVDLTAQSTEAGNSVNASALYDLFNSGVFNTDLNTIVGHLAIASDTNHGLLSTSQSMLNSIGKQRTSVCGVSMDEETTNLIKFQQSYSVASRLVTTIDDMLEKLINGTGRVGL